MMKRLIASLLCLMLCGALPCPAEGGARTELFSRAMGLCALMDECAADPQYLSLYRLDAAARQEIRNMGSHTRSDVRRADLYVLKDGFFSTWLSASKVDCGRLSEAVYRKLKDGIPASVGNMVNSGAPQAFLNASSALRCGTAFPAPAEDMPAYCLVHLIFAGGAEALCSFVRTQEGAVSAYVSAVQPGGLQKALRQMALSGVPESALFESSVLYPGE